MKDYRFKHQFIGPRNFLSRRAGIVIGISHVPGNQKRLIKKAGWMDGRIRALKKPTSKTDELLNIVFGLF